MSPAYQGLTKIVKFINYSWGCKPIQAQYSDHMYTTVNPNINQAIELTFDTNSCSANLSVH